MMNKTILIGRLTREPELRTTASGISVVSFSIAVNKRFKNAEGKYDADFIDCVAWKNTAEFLCKYFGKGQQVGIVGSLQTRSYQPQDGESRKITEVIADEVYFVGEAKKQAENGKNTATPPMGNEGFVPMPVNDEDLPF